MHTETTANDASGKQEPAAAIGKAVKEPAKRDPFTERMAKRGDVRRRLEDLMMSKESKDLW